MSYDKKCYDLAAAFLYDHPELDREPYTAKLAQKIQDAVECCIDDLDHERKEAKREAEYENRREWRVG